MATQSGQPKTSTGLLDMSEYGEGGEDGSGIDAATEAWLNVLDDDEEHGSTADEGDGDPDAGEDDPDYQDGDGDEDDPADDDDEGDDPDDDEGEEGEEDEGEDPAEELDPETKIKVKVDGEEQEVSLQELQNGYSRTQDYTRKTQALAEERRAIEAEKAKVIQEQQEWAQALNQLHQHLEAGLSTRTAEQWAELKATDEIGYYQARDQERMQQERLQAIRAEQARVQEEAQQHQQRELQRVLQEEQGKLLTAIPDWSDADVRTKELKQIQQYGESLGYSQQDLESIVDHRAIAVLRDAAKYRSLQQAKGKGAGKGKVRKVATSQKSLKSGTRSKPTQATRRKKAYENLKKRQDVNAAASFFESLED